MEATQKLHDLGQSLWINCLTRDRLNSGLLRHAIQEWSVTGLVCNLATFRHAIKHGKAYDAAIHKKLEEGFMGEELLFELAIEDLRHAADLFRPIHDQTDGMDGWVSMDTSPLLTKNEIKPLEAVVDLHTRARRPNLMIAIPGTAENLPVIEEAILAGVPVNATMLFTPGCVMAAAGALLRGIERRISAGLKPSVCSLVSMSVAPWDAAVMDKVPDSMQNQLGIAIARQTYKAFREFLRSPQWERSYNAGARQQRLRWSGTETRDSMVSDPIYVKALAAPLTINTMSENTLKALSGQDDVGTLMPTHGGDSEAVLARFTQAGIDIESLAVQLQEEALCENVKSWIDLMGDIASKSARLATASSAGAPQPAVR